MRLTRLAVRSFRNLVDSEFFFPPTGVALVGENGQGKTNLLEAVYYPVFFRSVHGAGDQEVGQFGGSGFGLEADMHSQSCRSIRVRFASATRKKQIDADGSPVSKLADQVGQWLAVAFLPQDLRLAAGPATERRRYLDRMLAIADRNYYLALAHYRSALAQRNAALKQGRLDLARAFDMALARAGAKVMAARFAWADQAGFHLAEEMKALGELDTLALRYRGDRSLVQPEAWEQALRAAESRDWQRRTTSVGPHRDDLEISLNGHAARAFGSTGQQRCVAIALKLLELGTLERSRNTAPALLLDDVFAELDRERQQRLAERIAGLGDRQVFLSSPREDELPPQLGLPRWQVRGGRVASG